MIKNWLLLSIPLMSTVFATCPSKFVRDDLLLIDKSGRQCFCYTKEDVLKCVDNFRFKNELLKVPGVNHSLIVFNDSIAFLNVVESFLDAKNYCVDEKGFHDVVYDAPVGNTVIE